MAKENMNTIRGRIDKSFFSRGKEFDPVKKSAGTSKQAVSAVLDDGFCEHIDSVPRTNGRLSK